jgi:hypothetical protein
LKGKDAELNLSQSAFIVTIRNVFGLGDLKYVVYAHDKVKLFTVPLKDHILVFSAESSINEVDTLKKITDHIRTVGPQLTLHPPSNILDEDKKKILKNLYESGMEKEVSYYLYSYLCFTDLSLFLATFVY